MRVRAFLAFVPALAACAADTFVTGDASSSADGGGADGPSGPTCGANACAAGETCCVSTTDGGTYTCLHVCPQQQNGNAVASLACTSGADCPAGNVCCMRQTNNVTSSLCEPQCGSSEVQLCDPSAADAGCPPNAPCSSMSIQDWKLPQSFGTCGGLGVP